MKLNIIFHINQALVSNFYRSGIKFYNLKDINILIWNLSNINYFKIKNDIECKYNGKSLNNQLKKILIN